MQSVNGGTRRNLPSDLAAPFTGVRRQTEHRLAQMLQVPLPEVFPIPASTPFAPQVFKATAAIETQDIGLSVVVPTGNVGILTGLSFQITNMLTTTNVSWTLLFNNGPVPGYNNLIIFPRNAPFVGNTVDTPVRIPENTTVTVQFNNIDGGAYTVGAAVTGWFWPASLGKLWMTQGSV